MIGQQSIPCHTQSHIYIKGSGNSYCFNNHLNHDLSEFINFNLPFQPHSIALSGLFIIAIDGTGTAYMWGTLSSTIIHEPTIIHHKVIGVSCGWDHALLKTSNHSLYGLGSNRNMQLGILSNKPTYYYQPILIKQQCQKYAAGFRQSYYTKQGVLWGCGQTNKYQLGYKSKQKTSWIQLWNIQSEIKTIVCGKRYLLVMMQSNQVYGLGYNDHNVFNHQSEYLEKPTPLYTHFQILEVASGWTHVTLLLRKGQVVSYGRNDMGQLGHPSSTHDVNLSVAIRKVVSGTEFTFLISQQGHLYGYGWNEHQNITNSSELYIKQPCRIELPSACVQVVTYPAITIVKCQ